MTSGSPAAGRSAARAAAASDPEPHLDDRTPRNASSWSRRHDLALFLVLAFLLSWLPWPLVALNPDSSPMVPFGPLLAAIVVAVLTEGRRGLGRLLGQLTRWRRGWRWYVAALLLPPVTSGLAAGLALALGGSGTIARPDWALAGATFASTLLLIGLFEEAGWRGYALPRLQQRMSGLAAALLLGGIWALWHLPELVSDPTGQRPPVQFVIIVVAQSVFLTWLYNSTDGSLPLVMLSHAGIDTVLRFVLPGFTGGSYQLLWWCQAGLWSAIAIFVVMLSGAALVRHRRAT